MNKKQGFSSVLGIILILIIVAGGVYWYSQNKTVTPTPAGTSDVASLDTSDWQTYRNEEYGFEFKYPLSWCVQPASSNQTCEGEVSIAPLAPNVSVDSYPKIMVGGREAGSTGWTDPGTFLVRGIVFSNPRFTLSFSIPIGPSDVERREVVESLLSTFKFTK